MRRVTHAGPRSLVNFAIVGILAFVGVCAPRPAAAYSVLAHEANVDALWDSTISKMLQERFPGATPEELLEARAYAYHARCTAGQAGRA